MGQQANGLDAGHKALIRLECLKDVSPSNPLMSLIPYGQVGELTGPIACPAPSVNTEVPTCNVAASFNQSPSPAVRLSSIPWAEWLSQLRLSSGSAIC